MATLRYTNFKHGEPAEPVELTCTTAKLTNLVDVFPQHPRYEACAPSDHNLGYREGDGNHPLTIAAPYLPYADTVDYPPVGYEPAAFKARDYLKAFENQVDWRTLRGPDVDVVAYKFIERARSQHGLSLDSIDEFLLDYDQESARKVLSKYAQRDPPSWAHIGGQQDDQLLDHTPRRSPQSDEHLDEGTKKLCLICKTFYCLRHTDEYYNCKEPKCKSYILGCGRPHHRHITQRQYLPQSIAKRTENEIRAASLNQAPSDFSCAAPCFMTMTRDDQNVTRKRLQDEPWSEEEREGLLTTLQNYGPDESPCTIGRLIGQPCIDIWLLRCDLIEEGKLSFTPAAGDRESMDRTGIPVYDSDEPCWNDDSKGVRLNAVPRPCNHVGPCQESDDCVCRRAGFHCSSLCRCESDCCMRWKGCGCAQHGSPCHAPGNNNFHCPCAEGGRECEVGTCIGCKPSVNCKNMVIQFAKRPRLEVKMGKYGLGTFALEHIKKGRFIGEYTTEVNILEHDAHKVHARKHVELNYSYDTTFGTAENPKSQRRKGRNKATSSASTSTQPLELPFYTYDAARIGSVMRYINDSYPRKKHNVEARYLFAQGEQHIAIFAKDAIKVGQELFLDYGRPYWHHKDDEIADADADVEDEDGEV
ncbi:unnamed protein product [Peniophora sp. CBMAI 1063]|nr:unnamed protein product [Peniophora sp. CBMAI 1063]